MQQQSALFDEAAALNHLRIATQNLEFGLFAIAPEADVEHVFPPTPDTMRSGSQHGSIGSMWSLFCGASGRKPSMACIGLKTEPAVHA